MKGVLNAVCVLDFYVNVLRFANVYILVSSFLVYITNMVVCKSCIVLHYSTTKSCDCPECGLSLGTQPMAQVKYDHVKDSLVNKIFPQLRIHDEKLGMFMVFMQDVHMGVLELAFYEKHNIPMDQQTKERLARVVETEQALNTI